ncbi:uncharacterized protein LOC111381443 isoform X2 [Olea europaea var. sylvestris]|uniref:uncharacterized protein LOC111381443 isoform X2 n=1 Tax=Olea europaea var. sylvestris TaxID=158386 RepID=UPI000C1CDB7C|nr:uncharacterized protein LOC111381443 isoform X2 [Olea europaea var. sylvestris]
MAFEGSRMMKGEDFSEEQYLPVNKRSRLSSNSSPSPLNQYNPLGEPSPLGLQLRKSPSLLDLIQMRLSQESTISLAMRDRENFYSGGKKEIKGTALGGTNDKLKASNFSASLLRIGSWEYVSRYEGDLVAKWYFAKHKLVWEVLEGGLKSKIEIQWSDIMSVKANFPDNGPASLTVLLARQPTFFRETDPQPKKHTLWQATSDFTHGQASINRQHFLLCPPALLNKHYEKLIQCDVRLNNLSRQTKTVMESPYFDSQLPVLKDLEQSKNHEFNQLAAAKGSSSSGFQDVVSADALQSCSVSTENVPKEALPPTLVMDLRATEGNGIAERCDFQGQKNWEQLNSPGLRPAMSMDDLVNHIGHCISEQLTSGSLPSDEASECQDMLENIAQDLLSDTQSTAGLDEKSLMKKVNSLCCLLQDPATASSAKIDGESQYAGTDCGKNFKSPHKKAHNGILAFEEDFKDGSGFKQVLPMPRIDSFGDFLINLPRIASLPKLLFDIAEDDECQSR